MWGGVCIALVVTEALGECFSSLGLYTPEPSHFLALNQSSLTKQVTLTCLSPLLSHTLRIKLLNLSVKPNGIPGEMAFP